MQDSTRTTSLQAMNPRWLAPEVLSGGAANLDTDVFAFGVILWELLVWQLPWGPSNPWVVVNQVTAGERLAVPPLSELPGPDSGSWPQLNRYIAIMQSCWAHDPVKRPSFQQIMAELRDMEPEYTNFFD